MKKILYVLSDLPKIGPTNQTLSIIKAAKKKFDVSVLTLFDETDLHSVKNNYINTGIKVDCLNLKGYLSTISRGDFYVKKYALENQIDIIHSYGTISDYLCEKACENTRIKHIISLRVFPKEDFFTRMNFFKACFAYKLYLKTLKKCQNVVCCSNSLLNMMKKKYNFAKKFNAIQNGVDLEKYKFDTSIIKQNDFICVSSIIERKRLDESVDGFLKSNTSKNSKLYIAGDGSLLESLKLKYKEYKNVIFLGRVDNVETYLSNCQYFLSSSESEGLPNSLLEAMSMGLIPIVSDIPQHLEVLTETMSKYYSYHLGDVSELSNIIDLAFQNNTFNRNRELLLKSNFNAINMGKKYCDLYYKVLREK